MKYTLEQIATQLKAETATNKKLWSLKAGCKVSELAGWLFDNQEMEHVVLDSIKLTEVAEPETETETETTEVTEQPESEATESDKVLLVAMPVTTMSEKTAKAVIQIYESCKREVNTGFAETFATIQTLRNILGTQYDNSLSTALIAKFGTNDLQTAIANKVATMKVNEEPLTLEVYETAKKVLANPAQEFEKDINTATNLLQVRYAQAVAELVSAAQEVYTKYAADMKYKLTPEKIEFVNTVKGGRSHNTGSSSESRKHSGMVVSGLNASAKICGVTWTIESDNTGWRFTGSNGEDSGLQALELSKASTTPSTWINAQVRKISPGTSLSFPQKFGVSWQV